MHRFSRLHLSAEVALNNLRPTYLGEKSQLAENIALIAVIDHRQDYLAAGYSCMRSCCTQLMGLTVDQALRRIQVARTALRFPDVFEYLADGRLSVTTAAVLAPHLEPGTAAELLAEAANRSKYEITQLLAERSRPLAISSDSPAGELLVETSSCQHAPAHADSSADVGEPTIDALPQLPHAPAHVEKPRRGRVSPCAMGGHEVRLSITNAEHDDLRAVLALLAHSHPSGDPALVYARAMKLLRAQLEKQRLGLKPGAALPAGTGRSIPKPLRRLVWERDGGRCAFLSSDGHRCEETGRLEIDHIEPLALGGKSTPENLRVLCSAHNRFEAERVLGKEHMHRRRELAERERARDKVAAAASAERTKARAAAREEARKERHDDIKAALRGLGATAAEAQRCAGMADAMPGATLEECLKAALIELARPVALRGERIARRMG